MIFANDKFCDAAVAEGTTVAYVIPERHANVCLGLAAVCVLVVLSFLFDMPAAMPHSSAVRLARRFHALRSLFRTCARRRILPDRACDFTTFSAGIICDTDTNAVDSTLRLTPDLLTLYSLHDRNAIFIFLFCGSQ